ncbi:MAG: class I SAM-dependent methyltransferase [Faecalibacterium sp.]|nr:class I SAM-dependent methyltransferase [Faecalibacterium sp.]
MPEISHEQQLLQQHLLRTQQDDCRMGGISVEQRKPSRFAALGAEAVQSSDYRCLDHIFTHHLPLTEQDTLLDVGCGEGRVLTYLHLQGCKARLAGIELDPEVAETARRRVQGTDIAVHCGNILDADELLAQTTVFYLFNPFNGKIFSKFVAKLEKTMRHPIRMAYLFDYYAEYLADRPGWQRLAKEQFARPGADDAHYSVWQFVPQGKAATQQRQAKR